ncbi:FAD/NAD(P)-binding protein [Evansella sp. AB-rgal1]|uniref:FAD/NAD(P)-binding protein n=1 Tax=Evansella sp. AB-rgal1 TaxID=3242696 RepID=UPI00359DD9CD
MEWLIIGGGIHGCTIANYLISSGKATSKSLKIIDPNPEPMYKWKRSTELIGMEFLRSPSVHHIDIDPLGLHKYAQEKNEVRAFYGKYDRPSLHLFNEHCETTLEKIEIKRSWYQGKVIDVEKVKNGWRVHTTDGKVHVSEKTVIAISINNQLNIPQWAKGLPMQEDNMFHIYDDKAPNLEDISLPIVVIGGGISAAHLTIKLSNRYPGQVTLLKRHPFRIHSFDSDPGWLGPKNLSFFHKINDYSIRRELINEARYKGSLPRELYNKLLYLEREKKISIMNGEVQTAKLVNKKIVLHLDGLEKVKAATVIFATGFVPTLPQEQWITNLIKREKLRCAKCGYPIVHHSLQWCDHLYVSGPLAELELGPVARNISGARKAAEQIVNNN